MFWWECWWVSGRVCCASGSGDGDVGVGNNSGSTDNSGDCGGDSCGHFGDCGNGEREYSSIQFCGVEINSVDGSGGSKAGSLTSDADDVS